MPNRSDAAKGHADPARAGEPKPWHNPYDQPKHPPKPENLDEYGLQKPFVQKPSLKDHFLAMKNGDPTPRQRRYRFYEHPSGDLDVFVHTRGNWQATWCKQFEKAHSPVSKAVRAGNWKGYPYNV